MEVPPELYKLKARWERLKSELGKTMRSTRTTKIPKCGVGSKVSDQRAYGKNTGVGVGPS